MKKDILGKQVHDLFKALEYVANYGEEVDLLLKEYSDNSRKCDYEFTLWVSEAIKCRKSMEKIIKTFENQSLEYPELFSKLFYLNDMISIMSENYNYAYERKWALGILEDFEEKYEVFNNQFGILSLDIRVMSLSDFNMQTLSDQTDTLLQFGSAIRNELINLKNHTKYLESYSTLDVEETLALLDNKLDVLENVYKPIFEMKNYKPSVHVNDSKKKDVSNKGVIKR